MSDNIFAELQRMSSSDSSIEESRRDLNKLCEYMQSLESQQEQIGYFAELRKIKAETFNKVGGFMVEDHLAVSNIPEEFHHDSYGFVSGYRLIYSGRFVLPVKDVKGDVAGFVGYDKFEEPKYLDSKNYGYKAKQTMLYGMERMREYYESGYVIVTEGSMCKLWLEEQGFNSLSTLGSYLSPYVIQILQRFGRRCIVIPDADETGNKLRELVRRYLPLAQIRQCMRAKDIDDSTMDQETNERIPHLVDQLTFELNQLVRNPFFKAELIA